jgi:ArsR family transcriptional regulator, arsenate/arsenite/antimonite-responsive transcriptional repressor
MATDTKDAPELIQGCCSLIDPGMSDADAALLAGRFKALADPTRVRILNLLVRNEELCACDVEVNFELSQPTISHHLSILRKAGLVDCDVRGKWCFYRASPEAINDLHEAMAMASPARAEGR